MPSPTAPTFPSFLTLGHVLASLGAEHHPRIGDRPNVLPKGQVLRIRQPAHLLLALALGLICLQACERKSSSPAVANAADSTVVADTSGSGTNQPNAKHDKKGSDKKSPFAFLNKNKKDEKAEEEPVPVELASVEVRDLPTYLGSTATLEAERKAEILSKASGQIVELRVEEGDWVKEGQVLARLESDAQAVALEEATARTRKLASDFDRVKALHGKQLASDKDLSDAQSAWEQTEASRKTAQLNLDYTRITAPFAGQIARRTSDRGQNVTMGTPLFQIVDPDPLLAAIHLPEREVRRLRPEQEVLISPDTDPDRDVRGAILRVSPVVDDRTGTIKVTCRVTAEGAALRPGSFVRVKLPTAVHEDVRVLPKRAVVIEGGENYVWKAVADSVLKLPVLTGAVDGNWIEISSGIEAGDRVVAVGHGALRNGSKFREVRKAAADSTSAARETQ